MAESYNGWTASKNPADFGGLQALFVAGENFAPGVRAGDVHTVLSYVAQQMHDRVEPVIAEGWHGQDDWGFAFRPNRNNPKALSCHASATAIDYNATRHPNGKANTFSARQVLEIRRILAELDGTVRWGGDFGGTKDEMHFEINASAARVALVAARLRGTPVPLPMPDNPVKEPVNGLLRPGNEGDLVRVWQGELWRVGIGVGVHDGVYGPATEAGTLRLQRAAGLDDDGIVGPATRAAGSKVPSYPMIGGAVTYAEQNGHPDVVIAFQRALSLRGWAIVVDGIYGPDTRNKLSTFQREKGLPVDGVGGPDTFVALHTRPV